MLRMRDALRQGLVRWFAARSPHQAEDLAQEVLLRLVSRPEPPDDPVAWVRTVRRTVWVDHLRRRRDETPFEEAPAPLPEVPDDETALAASWLPAFVELLPEPYREAVRLVDLEGVSQAALARRLGVSASTARSRVQRGRVLLKGHVDACCRLDWEDGEVEAIAPRGSGCLGRC
jgi:RNA polymerase sigma-70 factor (ECF subfamily)